MNKIKVTDRYNREFIVDENIKDLIELISSYDINTIHTNGNYLNQDKILIRFKTVADCEDFITALLNQLEGFDQYYEDSLASRIKYLGGGSYRQSWKYETTVEEAKTRKCGTQWELSTSLIFPSEDYDVVVSLIKDHIDELYLKYD